jgi:hypothetical protein
MIKPPAPAYRVQPYQVIWCRVLGSRNLQPIFIKSHRLLVLFFCSSDKFVFLKRALWLPEGKCVSPQATAVQRCQLNYWRLDWKVHSRRIIRRRRAWKNDAFDPITCLMTSLLKCYDAIQTDRWCVQQTRVTFCSPEEVQSSPAPLLPSLSFSSYF